MNYFLLEKYSYCRVEQFAKLGIISQRAAVNQRMQFWMNKLFVLRKKIYTHCCSLLIAYASRLVGWGGGLYLFIFLLFSDIITWDIISCNCFGDWWFVRLLSFVPHISFRKGKCRIFIQNLFLKSLNMKKKTWRYEFIHSIFTLREYILHHFWITDSIPHSDILVLSPEPNAQHLFWLLTPWLHIS